MAEPVPTDEGRPAVFLDRDGVVNERRPLLVRRWEAFRFRPGVLEAIARLAETPYAIVVVTNQGAVGWGWTARDELARIHREMVAAIEAAGGRVDGVYACTHRATEDCDCRKPKPGLLEDAARELGLRLGPDSWIVGDNWKDLQAGRAVGCRAILANPSRKAGVQGAAELAEAVVPGLPEAVDRILAAGAV